MNSAFTDAATIRKAAQVIAEDADVLKDCHTIDGQWPADEYATQHEYNERVKLVQALTEILSRATAREVVL